MRHGYLPTLQYKNVTPVTKIGLDDAGCLPRSYGLSSSLTHGFRVQHHFASPSRYIAVRRSAYDPATETYVTEIMLVTADQQQLCHAAERLGFEAALSLSKTYAREHRTEHLAWLMDSDHPPSASRALLHLGQLHGAGNSGEPH